MQLRSDADWTCRVQLPKLNLCVETAVNVDLCLSKLRKFGNDGFLTLIYYLALARSLSHFFSLALSFSRSCTSYRAFLTLSLRLSHSLQYSSSFPRHHLVDSLKSIFFSLTLKRLRCTDANPWDEAWLRGISSVFCCFSFFLTYAYFKSMSAYPRARQILPFCFDFVWLLSI